MRRLITTLLVDAVAGSALALSQATLDADADGTAAAAVASYNAAGVFTYPRRSAKLAELALADVQRVEPGIEFVHRWRPDESPSATRTDAEIGIYGAVARVPG